MIITPKLMLGFESASPKPSQTYSLAALQRKKIQLLSGHERVERQYLLEIAREADSDGRIDPPF